MVEVKAAGRCSSLGGSALGPARLPATCLSSLLGGPENHVARLPSNVKGHASSPIFLYSEPLKIIFISLAFF